MSKVFYGVCRIRVDIKFNQKRNSEEVIIMEQQSRPRTPFYRSIVFWFLLIVIGLGILGFVLGEELPPWLEFVNRLLR